MHRTRTSIAGDETLRMLQRRREGYNCEEINRPQTAVPSFDDHTVIVKMTKL